MTRAFRLFPLLLAAATLLLPAQADEPETLRARPLDLQALSPEWSELFAQLRAPATLRSTFTEERTFSFRQQPVRLQGTLRLSRERGLSLSYEEPEARTIIVDDRGVLLRDERGRSRTAPAEATAGTAPLRSILDFDLDALAQTFAVHGALQGDRWLLEFKPLETAPPRTPRFVAVHGTGSQVTLIELTPTARQQIRITIGETDVDTPFDADEVKQYFR